MVHRAPNTLTLIDKKAHGRKRRIIAQGFSEAALRSYEPTILTHIRKFGAELESDSSSTENWKDVSESRKWSKPHNMARWCRYSATRVATGTLANPNLLTANYLTFDIMTDVIFGESYALLERIQYRHIVKCIEESNVRTGVLLQAGELVTGRLDRRLFPEAIKGRNTFISFVTGLLKRRMQAQPLKRKDVFSFLLGAKDPETQQEMKPAEIGAEATTMIVAGKCPCQICG
jgi:cytochrome P450